MPEPLPPPTLSAIAKRRRALLARRVERSTRRRGVHREQPEGMRGSLPEVDELQHDPGRSLQAEDRLRDDAWEMIASPAEPGSR